MSIQNLFFQSPIGIIEIRATAEFITEVLFAKASNESLQVFETQETEESIHPLIQKCAKQLQEYFEGQRSSFDLSMHQEGSAFQQEVWAALIGIPYGKTISYGELSKRIGNTKAVRAVGTTNGRNSICIIVPCHRVVGSSGALTGYSGELWRKKWLLDHENKYANGVQKLF